MAVDMGHERTLSANNGHFISNVEAVSSDQLASLAARGISDVEQVLAAAAVPGVAPSLAEYLGINTEELNDLIERLKKSLPASIAARCSEPSYIRFPLGALFNPPTETGFLEELQTPIATGRASRRAQSRTPPTSVNHIPLMLPIQSQGDRGTCVAFAVTAMLEYHRAVSAQSVKLSEQFLYDETKKLDSDSRCGTWVAYAMKALAKIGQCEHQYWPYNPNAPCNNNGVQPPNARQSAKNFRIKGRLLPAKDVGVIKSALAENSNVALSVSVYDSWYFSSEVIRTGRIAKIGNESADSAHCMCVVGYQDTDDSDGGGGYFIVRNSWGHAWGHECVYGPGYGTIPYQYVAEEGLEAAALKGTR
jgi:C1A family cysteine protease